MPHPIQCNSEPLGVVLAGGAGQRMGGNKSCRMVGGHRLVDLALQSLAGACPRQVVVTGDVASLADLPCPVIADLWPGQGPLAALATALLETQAESIIVLAVDMPLVNPALLRLLIQSRQGQRVVASSSLRGPEPLLSYYHRLCLPAALRLLEKGERRPRFLLKAVQARILSPEEVAAVDPDGHSFFNVNFPPDLQKAEEILQSR